jgi:LTXXQ motif family protein
MLRKVLIAGVSWLALGVALIPAASVAGPRGGGFGGGGMHFGGGGMHFGAGGMHFGGGGMHFGGAPHFGGGGMHFGGVHRFGGTHFAPHNFAAHRFAPNRFAAHRFAHNFVRGHTHYAGVNHGARFAHNRLAQNHALHNQPVNHASHNNAGRFANRTPLANAGRQGAFNRGTGNAFTHAKWGGHEWGHHGFRRFWAGGVFWPFFWGDYFSYAFWPYDYYDYFWGWGPDALLWGAFWPDYEYPYWDYGYYGAGYYGGPYYGDIYGRYRHERTAAPAQPERYAGISPQEAGATCAGFAPGVDNLPFQRLAEIIQPTPGQGQAFDELKAAMAKASDILSRACPAEAPATPVARLDTMEERLQAMLQAGEVVRGPLERLYGLLSPEQRQRLETAMASGQPTGKGQVNLAKLCSSQAGFTNVPAQDIARTVSLTPQQRQGLDALMRVSNRAAGMLRETCPANVPNTLDARLDAAQARLRALIQAIKTIKPEVRTFFASLSSAQRSALNSEAPRTRTAAARR